MDKRKVEDLTMIYIHSYDKAMAEVKNPNFAVQIATNITLVAASIRQQERQSALDPFKILFENITGGAGQDESNGAAGGGACQDRPGKI